MSAFLCTPAHIGTLAAYAALERRIPMHIWTDGQGTIDARTDNGRALLVELLAQANLKSVSYRYAENEAARDFLGVSDPEYALQCLWESAVPLSQRKIWNAQERQRQANIIKMCHCLDYQSCEFPEWRTSDARAALDCIKEHAMREALREELDRAPWEMDVWERNKAREAATG